MAVVQTTPMRDAGSNTQPTFPLPARSCDSHMHVFEPGYSHVPNPPYTFPDATPKQYLEMADVLGLERMVLVSPTYYGTDNTLILDVLREVGSSRCRAVVRVEDDIEDAELDRYHGFGVRAIRLDLFQRQDWPIDDIMTYVRRTAARATPRGWHIQLYASGTLVRDLAPQLADLEGDFTIDHMGYMLTSHGIDEHDPGRDHERDRHPGKLTAADFGHLLGLLRQGNCWIKLTGPHRVMKDKPLSSVGPLARALVAARPDRLLWGTDWPHLPDGQRDTGELLNLLADWAPQEADRQQILVSAPDTLFFAD